MKTKLISASMAFALIVSAYSFNASAASNIKKIEVSQIELNKITATVRVNQIRTLYEYIKPSNADDKSVEWISSDSEIVTVDDEGSITGISPGTATITVKASNGKTAVCLVNVPDTIVHPIELDTKNEENAQAYINSGELISAATVKLEVENAAKKNGKGSESTVTFYEKSEISPAAINAAAYTAATEKVKIYLKFKTSNTNVSSNITINPVLAKNLTENIKLGIITDEAKTASIKQKFNNYFSNNIIVIQCMQKDNYSMLVKISANVNLKDLNKDTLHFYTYNTEKNKYSLIENTNYYIDSEGYLNFETEKADDIIITDKPLISI